MKVLRYGIGVVLVAGFAMTASCGGSSESGDDATAGESAGGGRQTAGSPGAGRSATGGARASGGGTRPGTAGSSAGVTNPGGTTSNPACPATAPTDAAACTLTGLQTSCAYSGVNCRCERAAGGTRVLPGGTAGGAGSGVAATGSREWQCTETLTCPTSKPTVGDACKPAAGTCVYAGMGSCSCSTQTSQWACRGGGMTGGGGASGGLNGGAGFSFGGRSNGGTGAGTAGGPSDAACPAAKPAADSACTGSEACPYAGGGCVCMNDKWSCL